jgi:hypothetical protein
MKMVEHLMAIDKIEKTAAKVEAAALKAISAIGSHNSLLTVALKVITDNGLMDEFTKAFVQANAMAQDVDSKVGAGDCKIVEKG